MTTRQEFCSTQVKGTDVKEFIEANKDLSIEEVGKIFKARNKQARERIIVNSEATAKRRGTYDKKIQQRKTDKNKKVSSNRFSALIDNSAYGTLRETIMNMSGVMHGGAGDSLELKIASTRNRYTNPLMGELERLNARVVNNENPNKGRPNFTTPEGKEFDKNIRIEWGIINGTGDKPTGDIKAKEVAKALNDITAKQIADSQAIGMQTGLRKNYAGMQSHNQSKISNITEKEYWDFTLKLLKEEQAVGFTQDAQIRKNIYDTLAGRDMIGFSTENLPLNTRETIQAFKNTRSLEFKSVEAEIEYHRRFGDNLDIIDTTVEALTRQSKAMASHSLFGFMDPAVAIQGDVNYIWDKHISNEEKARLQNEKNFGLQNLQARFNADVEELMNGTRVSKFTKNSMTYVGAKALTGTILNQFTNDAFMNSFQRFMRTGNVVGSIANIPINLVLAPFKILRTLFKAYANPNRAGLTKEEYIEVATYGNLADGMERQMYTAIVKDGTFEIQNANKFDTFINGMAKFTHTLAGNYADNQIKVNTIRQGLASEFRDWTNGKLKGSEKYYESFLGIYFDDAELPIIKQLKEAREGDGIHSSDMRFLGKEALEPLIQNDINLISKQHQAEMLTLKAKIDALNKEALDAQALEVGITRDTRDKVKNNIKDLEERVINTKNKIIQEKKENSQEELKRVRSRLRELMAKDEQTKAEFLEMKKKESRKKILKRNLDAIKQYEQAQVDKDFKTTKKIAFTNGEITKLKAIQDKIKNETKRLENDKYFYTKEDFKKVKKSEEATKDFEKAKEMLKKEAEQFQKEFESRREALYERKRIDLENRFSQMFIAETNRALNIGGASVKSIARRDGKQMGELGAQFLQLKSSATSMYFDLYQRILTHPHFSTNGKIGALAGTIAFMTLSGMISQMFSDAITNLGEPKKRSFSDLLAAGFMRGGAGGSIYDIFSALYGATLGGFFHNERVSQYGALAAIAGIVSPVSGDGVQLYQASIDLIPTGKDKTIKIDKFLNYAVKSAIPASNTFYLRAITNEAIAGLGAVLDDVTDGFIESTRQQKMTRRRGSEEGLFTGQTPRASLLNRD